MLISNKFMWNKAVSKAKYIIKKKILNNKNKCYAYAVYENNIKTL